MKNIICAVLISAVGLAHAQSVVVPNQFMNGDVVDANEINENFDVTASAVDQNSATITIIESEIDQVAADIDQILSDDKDETLPVSMGFDNVSRDYMTAKQVKVNDRIIGSSVAPGSTVKIAVDYDVNNGPNCPACVVQLRVGFSGQDTVECFHNGGAPANASPALSGTGEVELTAPEVPGVYYLIFDRTLDFSCNKSRNPDNKNVASRQLGFITVK